MLKRLGGSGGNWNSVRGDQDNTNDTNAFPNLPNHSRPLNSPTFQNSNQKHPESFEMKTRIPRSPVQPSDSKFNKSINSESLDHIASERDDTSPDNIESPRFDNNPQRFDIKTQRLEERKHSSDMLVIRPTMIEVPSSRDNRDLPDFANINIITHKSVSRIKDSFPEVFKTLYFVRPSQHAFHKDATPKNYQIGIIKKL